MPRKDEPWTRVCITFPDRLLDELDKLPLDRSTAIQALVEYGLSARFLLALVEVSDTELPDLPHVEELVASRQKSGQKPKAKAPKAAPLPAKLRTSKRTKPAVKKPIAPKVVSDKATKELVKQLTELKDGFAGL